MDLELVTIGTELLLGHTVDTNAAFLSRALAPAGALVVRTTTVGDDPAAIRDAVAAALQRTRFVVTTGGLGPTRDDLSKRAVAELFEVPLQRDDALLAGLERRWRAMGRAGAMPEANRSQADVPAGASVLANEGGTAPGLWLEGPDGVVVMLPGVPREMRALTREHLLPRVAGKAGAAAAASRVLRTTGIAESAVADLLRDVEQRLEPLTLAYLPGPLGVDLRITAWGLESTAAQEALDGATAALTPVLGSRFYGSDETDLATVVLDHLRARALTLAVAESCTGGLVGARVTAVPGASDVFVGGVIAYANEVKHRELGVAEVVLEREGAVSEAAVTAMARGVAERFKANAAVAVSGVAGPEGGTVDKPVGTVWLAALLDGRQRQRLVVLPGDREEIRARAAQAALDLLRGLSRTD